MKEIIAIIRPSKWPATKERLTAMSLSYTQFRVYGRGRQKGLRYPSRSKQSGKEMSGIYYVPKRWLIITVADERVKETIQALIQVNQTGTIGDGKIFVLPVEDVLRLRTGERGSLAA
jgi:nitrogen regulatory protein PII 2